MRRLEMLIGIATAIFSAIASLYIIPKYVEPSDFTQVSPAMLPQVCVILIGLLGALLFVSRLFMPASDAEPLPISAKELTHLAFVLVIFSVGAALILNVDFIIGGAVLTAMLMVYLKEQNWLMILSISLATPTLLFVSFDVLIGANLP